jgi:hypothetical protein
MSEDEIDNFCISFWYDTKLICYKRKSTSKLEFHNNVTYEEFISMFEPILKDIRTFY